MHIIVFILKATQAKHGIPKCNTLLSFSNPYSDKELKVPKHRVMGKTRTTTCGSVQSIRKLKIQSLIPSMVSAEEEKSTLTNVPNKEEIKQVVFSMNGA